MPAPVLPLVAGDDHEGVITRSDSSPKRDVNTKATSSVKRPPTKSKSSNSKSK
jgi:hypothetical protein